MLDITFVQIYETHWSSNISIAVVWNPWIEKAKGMADFGDNDYPEMICVEAGYVSSKKQLSPGEEYTGSQVISLE